LPVEFITAHDGEIEAAPPGAIGVQVGVIVGDTNGVTVEVLDIVIVTVALCRMVCVGDGPNVLVPAGVMPLVSVGVLIKSITGAVGIIFFGLHDWPKASITAATASAFNAADLFFILSRPEIFLISCLQY
jgi:hypothetical protein